MRIGNHCLHFVVAATAVALGSACGGSTPPPKSEDTGTTNDTPKPEAQSGATVSQELGSIDERAVVVMFDKLQNKLETCHTQGRSRVEYLSGDMKVFLRIGKDGRVKYGLFEQSTLGDRDTERCILDLFAATDWPKPIGGEAEVRNGFGWPAGSERQPAQWGPEKVIAALDEDKETKKTIDKCKGGSSGDFHVTAYVEPGEAAPEHESKPIAAKGNPKHGGGKAGSGTASISGKAAAKAPDHGGKFKAIGVAPPNKDGVDKIDCIVDALRGLALPSPGSYAAKVTFSL